MALRTALPGLLLTLALLAPASAHAQLAGVYQVGGAGAPFASPAAAATAASAQGLAESVVFRVMPGTYDGDVNLYQVPGAGPTRRITFEAALPSQRPVLRNASVSAPSVNWVVRISGTPFVTLRNLTFEAAAPAPYGRMVYLEGSTTDVTIEGCAFTGHAGTASEDAALIGGNGGAGYPRLTVRNSTFTYGSFGLHVWPAASGLDTPGLRVEGSTFVSQQQAGLFARPAAGSVIHGNTVLDWIASSGGYVGLDLTTRGDGVVVSANGVRVSTGAFGVRDLRPAGDAHATLFVNNMISVSGPSLGARGLSLSRGVVLHNTVRILSTHVTAGALHLDGAGPTVEVVGNVLVADGAAAAILRSSGSAHNVTSDRNNLVTTTGALVSWGGVAYTTLAAYQAALGLDAASVSVSMTFVDPSATTANLRLAGASLTDLRLVAGTNPKALVDLDGSPRDAYNAKMGAHEGTPLPPLTGTYTVYAASGFPAPAFATLDAASTVLAARGVLGPVTLALRPGARVEKARFGDIARTSAASPIVILPEDGPVVLQSAAASAESNFILRLDGTRHVQIQDLVFDASTSTGSTGRALHLDGAVEDVFIADCAFIGRTGWSPGGEAALVYGVGPAARVTIRASTFTNGSHALLHTGLPGQRARDFVVDDHPGTTTNASITGTDSFGIDLTHHEDVRIERVRLVSGRVATSGLRLESGTGAVLTDVEVRVPTAAGCGDGIVVLSWEGLRIANTLVRARCRGVQLGSGVSATEIVHSTLHATDVSSGAALEIAAGASGVQVVNTLLVGGARPGLAVETPAAVTQLAHTLVRSDGPTAALWGGDAYPTAADLEAAVAVASNLAGGPVTFVDAAAGDLRLAGASVGDAALAGTPRPDVPADRFGAPRSSVFPYRGGHEPSTPLVPVVRVALAALLQGAYTPPASPGAPRMRTALNAAGVLPLAHPYGGPAFVGRPAHHVGLEVVPAGFFAAHPEVVDWVVIGLRPTATSGDVARSAELLRSDGRLIGRDGDESPALAGVVPGEYHVVLYHRTHLAAMSADRQMLVGGSASVIDLTLPGAAYGGGVAEVAPGVFALVGGDGDADGVVLAGDRQAVWLPVVGQSGYLMADFDLDGTVLAGDRQAVWTPNVGRESSVPGGVAARSRPAVAGVSR